MHELSIAYNIVQIADEAAQEADVPHIDVVHLRLGALSGVVKDALLFGYDIATQDTRLAGSRLEIQELPVIIYCPQCQEEKTIENIQLFRCPTCDTPTADIRQGKELEIDYLEYEHETAHP